MGKKQKPKSQRKRQKQLLQKKKESGLRQKGLPIDVIHEILVRSPVQTLGKLRCVCKQWGSIISQPSFQEDHHRQCCPANPLVLLTRCKFNGVDDTKSNTLHLSTYTSEGTLVKTFSKTVPHESSYIPMQSCLGLVCLGPKFSGDPILICNPSTEELITLPPTQQMHTCIGFGYATFTKQFKVVRFFRHPVFDETQICCEVFTLGTSGWREARNPPPQNPPNFFTSDAPFLHGALHLLPYLRPTNEDAYISIDAFDIETETYTKIPLPEYFHTVKSSLHMMYLKEFGGSLCLTFHFPWVLEFWCLDYYNREWVKKYSFSLESLGDHAWQVDPLKIMPDGNMMLSLEGDEEALYYYNFRDKSFTKDTKMNCSGTLYMKTSLHLASR